MNRQSKGFNIRNISTMVPRRLTILESLRADNIPNTVPSKQQGTGDLFLRISGNIRADHSQTHTEAQTLEITQPESDQPTPFIRVGKTDQQS